jgi:hypothetical protein
MPATGRVNLSLGYADGSDLLAAASVNMQVTGSFGGKRSTDLPPQNRISAKKEVGLGETVFPFVGLDLRFQADVRSGPLKFRKHGFAGPRVAGEQIDVRMEVDPRVAALVGRAVDSSGEPFEDRDIELGFIWGEVVERRKTVRTDALGRFEYATTLGRRRPEALFGELRRGPEESAYTTRVALDDFQGGRRLDLGDVPFLSSQVYAYGRVVDDLNQPVEEYRAWVEKFVQNQGRRRQAQWVRDPEMSVVQGELGRLEVLGEAKDECRIRVAAGKHLVPDPVALHAGREFEVMLVRGARVAGQVLIDEWVPAKAIRILAEGGDAPRRKQSRILGGGGELRSFEFPALPAGGVDLSFFLRSENLELLRLSGFETREGEDAEDSRLGTIDLRGRLNRIRIELRNASGQMPRRGGARLLVEPVIPGGGVRFFDLRPGAVELATLQASLDLTVLVPGFKMQRIKGAAGIMRVDLQRATAQVIQLIADDLPLTPPYSLNLRLLPSPSLGLPGQVAEAYTGKREKLAIDALGLMPNGRINRLGRLQLRNLSSGTYRVRLTLRKRGRRGSARIDLPDLVDIAPGIRPWLELAVPPELVRAAIEKLR